MSALSKLTELANKKDPFEGMSSEEKKLARIDAILKTVDDGLSKNELVEAFEVIAEQMKALEEKNREEFELIREAAREFLAAAKDENKSDFERTKAEMRDEITSKVSKMKDGYTPKKGIDYHDGKDGSPDTGEQIVEKINSSKSLIKRKSVNGLPALKKKVDEMEKSLEKGGKAKTGWGAHPLMVKALGAVIDKNTRIINFKGSALSSVVRLPDGTVEVEMSIGAGTAYTETPTGLINGSNTTYTVAHTITTVYNFAINGQFLHPDTDYTFSGTTITLLSALPAVLSGKPFTITYA